jgi:hypothetical protein
MSQYSTQKCKSLLSLEDKYLFFSQWDLNPYRWSTASLIINNEQPAHNLCCQIRADDNSSTCTFTIGKSISNNNIVLIVNFRYVGIKVIHGSQNVFRVLTWVDGV